MNKPSVDCLFIGYNDVEFSKLEQSVRLQGTESVNYRNINLNFINYEYPLSIIELYNKLVNISNKKGTSELQLLNLDENISLTIAYLASFLKRNELNYAYTLSFSDRKDELIEKLINNNFLTIAIPTTYYYWEYPIIEIIKLVRKYSSKSKIILGGPYVLNQFNSLSENHFIKLINKINADYYIINSQGEAALVRLIKQLKESGPLESVPNLFFEENGKYKFTFAHEENNSIEVNHIEWNSFNADITDYVFVRSTVSCPYKCSFCNFGTLGGKYQQKSVAGIEKELNEINQLNKVKLIHFIDDTINASKNRFKDLLKIIIKNQYRFKWHSFLRCQFLDEESVQLMKESGCLGVYLGIESGSDEILSNMHKSVSVAQYKRGIGLLKKYDILVHASFIVGFPGETEESVLKTQQFIEETGVDFYAAKVFYYSHLAPIHKQSKKYNLKGNGYFWSHNTMTSHQAQNLVEDFLFNVKTAIRIPDFGFDFSNVIYLMSKGLPLDSIKKYLIAFNNTLKEKLIAGNPREKVGLKEIKRFINALNINDSDMTDYFNQDLGNTIVMNI